MQMVKKEVEVKWCSFLSFYIFFFRYVQLIWSLEMVKTHENRAFEECTADLQVSKFAKSYGPFSHTEINHNTFQLT